MTRKVRGVVTTGRTKSGVAYRAHGDRPMNAADLAAFESIADAAAKQFREMVAQKEKNMPVLRIYKGAKKGSETRALMRDFKVPALVIANVTTPPGTDREGKPVNHTLTLGPDSTCKDMVVAQCVTETPEQPTIARTVPEEVADLHEWEGVHRAQGWR